MRWSRVCCAPLVDQDLSLVFNDMTTISAAGLSEQKDDVRKYGMSKPNYEP